MEQLLEANALDVFFSPIIMKKNRPAYKMTVLCNESDMDKIQAIIFKNTTTIGIRYRYEQRVILDRKIINYSTPIGDVLVKEVKFNNETYNYVEYESAKKLSLETGVSIKEIYKMVK